MPIINSILSGGAPVSADTTMSLPIDIETSGNNISMFGGSYTSTLNASTVGQTKGYKNDAYIVLNQDDTESLMLSQTETFPSGSFKSAVMSSTSIYLDDTKTNIVGTESPVGFEVSYEPTEEGVIKANYTTVGSVTVDSNNVASGFSSSNYLLPDYSLDISQDFEIGCKCKINSSNSNYTPVFGTPDSAFIFLGKDNNNHPHFNLRNSGMSWGSGPHLSSVTMSIGETYYLKGIKSGDTITLYASTDGETWESASSTFSIGTKTSPFRIGIESGNSNAFPGDIYLDDCYVKIGDSIVYQPNPSAVYPKENFTKVGSPTITDGVLGNLTGSNYLEFPGVGIGSANTWEIFTKVKTGSAVNSSYYILGGGGTACFDFGIAGYVWKFYLSANGNSWNLASNISNNINASTSTWYYVKFYFTGTKYEMDVSTDGETWTNVAEYASTTKVYDCPTMRVGNTNDRNWPWKDYIDLNETYIKVNDKIVWRPILYPSAGYITVGEGYAYADENTPPFSLSSDLTQTASQLIVHSEDFVEEAEYYMDFKTVGGPTIDIDHWINCSYKGLVADRKVENFSTFEIGLKIGGCNNTNPNQIMFASTYGNYTAIAINIVSGKFAIYLSSNASSSYDIASGTTGSYSVQTSTTYYLKLIFDGSKYVLSYSLDGETYTDDITVTSSTKIPSFTPTVCSWVKNGTNIEASYSGFIDLDDVYVKTDGNLVWSPYVSKTIKKGTLFLTKPTSSTTSDVVCANSMQSSIVQKYTTTGSSVVVDSNHRASGFTTTDYIKIPLNAWMGQYNVETVIHFKTPETFGSDYYQGLGIDDSYDWRVGVKSDGVFCGSAGSFGSMIYSMQPNTEYWMKLLSPSGDVYMSTDGENYTRIGGSGPRFNNNQVMQNFCLGKMYNDSHAFEGTIYLDDCYIKLDGVIASAPFMTESMSVSPTPTGTYAGSVVTPLNMSKTVTMDTTLTKLLNVT